MMTDWTDPSAQWRSEAATEAQWRAHCFADPVEQFWRSWRIALGRIVVWHLAAFLAGLPSKGQEIDDKMPSNSS
jgi:hypothetical protein